VETGYWDRVQSGYTFIASSKRFLLGKTTGYQLAYWYQTRQDNLGMINDNIASYRFNMNDHLTTDLSWEIKAVYIISHSLSYLWEQETYLYPADPCTEKSLAGSLSYQF